MRVLGTVSADGGPFLLADAVAARAWRGVAEPDTYRKMGELFEGPGRTRGLGWSGAPWPVGGLAAVAWESGTGTAQVVEVAGGGLALVKVRAGDKAGASDAAAQRVATAPSVGAATALGEVEVKCGVLAVLWVPEDGAKLSDADLAKGTGAPAELVVDGSSLLVRLPAGRYRCTADEVELAEGSAARCFLSPVR